jgi:hypothetical protein
MEFAQLWESKCKYSNIEYIEIRCYENNRKMNVINELKKNIGAELLNWNILLFSNVGNCKYFVIIDETRNGDDWLFVLISLFTLKFPTKKGYLLAIFV